MRGVAHTRRGPDASASTNSAAPAMIQPESPAPFGPVWKRSTCEKS